jgi:hypothetical protein
MVLTLAALGSSGFIKKGDYPSGIALGFTIKPKRWPKKFELRLPRVTEPFVKSMRNKRGSE